MFKKKMGTTSSISRGVTVVGEIFGDGTVQLFGRVKGDIRASTIWVKEGAEVEGDLLAEELIVEGLVKGTIRANRVKLFKTATVQGDIFHRSLTIDPQARFEGFSRRGDSADDALASGMPLRGIRGPASPDEAFMLAPVLREPAAGEVSLTIADAGSSFARSSQDDGMQENIDPIDRVQRALSVVAALQGGTRLADLSLMTSAAEPRSKNGSDSSSSISIPAPSDSESDNAD